MPATRQSLPAPRFSAAWNAWLPIQYRIIKAINPLVGFLWRAFAIGNIVELRVVGRRSGETRSVMLGLLRDGDLWFLGHPNGDVPWTLNLAAAGTALLVFRPPTAIAVRARRVESGELRDRAIAATGQHVFPGNLVYRLARAHVRAVGAYFLVEVGD